MYENNTVALIFLVASIKIFGQPVDKQKSLSCIEGDWSLQTGSSWNKESAIISCRLKCFWSHSLSDTHLDYQNVSTQLYSHVIYVCHFYMWHFGIVFCVPIWYTTTLFAVGLVNHEHLKPGSGKLVIMDHIIKSVVWLCNSIDLLVMLWQRLWLACKQM